MHGESSKKNRRQWDSYEKAGVFLGSSCLASPPHHYTYLNFSGSEDLGSGSRLCCDGDAGRHGAVCGKEKRGHSVEEAVSGCVYIYIHIDTLFSFPLKYLISPFFSICKSDSLQAGSLASWCQGWHRQQICVFCCICFQLLTKPPCVLGKCL